MIRLLLLRPTSGHFRPLTQTSLTTLGSRPQQTFEELCLAHTCTCGSGVRCGVPCRHYWAVLCCSTAATFHRGLVNDLCIWRNGGKLSPWTTGSPAAGDASARGGGKGAWRWWGWFSDSQEGPEMWRMPGDGPQCAYVPAGSRFHNNAPVVDNAAAAMLLLSSSDVATTTSSGYRFSLEVPGGRPCTRRRALCCYRY